MFVPFFHLIFNELSATGRRSVGAYAVTPRAAALVKLVCLLLVPLWLAGCASPMVRGTIEDKPLVNKLPDLHSPTKAIGLDDETDDAGPSQSSMDLIPSALEESDPLPKINVAPLSFANTPLQDVLQAVVGDSHLSLAVVWDNPDSKVSRSTVSMSQLSGDLTSVLNKLAESYGFYWQYKEGMLHIAADRQYVAPVPPIADLFESLPIMVKTLGGTDVFLDRSARMITFRAGSQSFSKIKGYLDLTRRNRSLIVYDTYLWEVILNDSSHMGIDWGSLPGSPPTTALSVGPGGPAATAQQLFTAGLVNAASGGTGLALSLTGSNFSMNVLIDFLRSQGTINSLSQPKIQLLSGGKATLKDEIATTYVSRVGSSSISAGTVIPGSVETSEVKTGVTLEVSGDVSDGTIYSDIALRVSDLVSMDSATVSGTVINLPKTSSREVHTHVRAKQGDTILLAGIQYDKISNIANTGMGIERSHQVDAMRSELIIILKPRIKSFIKKTTDEKPRVTSAAPAPAPVFAPAAPVAVSAVVPVAAPVVKSVTASLPVPTPVPVSDPVPVPAVAPIVEKAVPRTPQEWGPGVYVQLAAFATLSNAKGLRQDVERALDDLQEPSKNLQIVSAFTARDGASHRLLAGPFATRQSAEQWAARTRSVIGERTLFVMR
jgi:cell division septation protein DedD